MTSRTSDVSAEAVGTGRHASELRDNTVALNGAVEELRHSVIQVVRTSTADVDRRQTQRTHGGPAGAALDRRPRRGRRTGNRFVRRRRLYPQRPRWCRRVPGPCCASTLSRHRCPAWCAHATTMACIWHSRWMSRQRRCSISSCSNRQRRARPEAGLRPGPHRRALPSGLPPRAGPWNPSQRVRLCWGQSPPGGFQGRALTLLRSSDCPAFEAGAHCPSVGMSAHEGSGSRRRCSIGW